MSIGRFTILSTVCVLALSSGAYAQDAGTSLPTPADAIDAYRAQYDAYLQKQIKDGKPALPLSPFDCDPSADFCGKATATGGNYVGMLIQKKYPGIAGAPASHLFVNNEEVRLNPLVAANSVSEPNVRSIPYLVVSDQDYLSELKRHVGYAGKPANHVLVRGKETIILKSSEVDTNISRYPGLANKPSNHVVIDGVHTILVKKSEYLPLLHKSIGIADLPANYIMLNNEVVQVIAVNNDSDFNPTASIPKDFDKVAKSTTMLPSYTDAIEAYRTQYDAYIQKQVQDGKPVMPLSPFDCDPSADFCGKATATGAR